MKKQFIVWMVIALNSGILPVGAQSRRYDAVYTSQVKTRNEKNVKKLTELKIALDKELEQAGKTQQLSDSLFRKQYDDFRDCLPIFKYRLSQYAGIEMRIRLKLQRYNLMNDTKNYLYAENALKALRAECTTPGKQLPSDLMWLNIKYRFMKYKAILGQASGNYYLEAAAEAAADGNTSESERLMGIYTTGQLIGSGSSKPGDYKGLTGKGNFLLNEWTLYHYRKVFDAIEENMEYINRCYIPSADRLEMYNQQMEDCEELYTEIKRAFYLNNAEKLQVTPQEVNEAMKERFNRKGIE